MSNRPMPHLDAAPKPKKERLSLVLDVDKKQALHEIAKKQNRSLNFVVLDIINKGIQEAQEEAEYQKYVENRVMQAYKRLETEGSDGISSAELKKRVMATLDEKLKGNQ